MTNRPVESFRSGYTLSGYHEATPKERLSCILPQGTTSIQRCRCGQLNHIDQQCLEKKHLLCTFVIFWGHSCLENNRLKGLKVTPLPDEAGFLQLRVVSTSASSVTLGTCHGVHGGREISKMRVVNSTMVES